MPTRQALASLLRTSCLVGVVHLFAGGVAALPPDLPLGQLVVQHWATEDGLPLDSVAALWASPRGPLWVATEEGLARFDGVSFEPVGRGPGGLPTDDITDLFEDDDGTLWIASWRGLSRLRDGRLESFGPEQGLRHELVYCVRRGGDGALYAGTARGLVRFDGTRFANFVDPHWGDELNIRALAPARDGSLWVGSTGGGLSRFADGRFTAHYSTADGLPENWVQALLVDRQGALWIGTHDGLGRFDGRAFTRFGRAVGLPATDVRRLAEDPAGGLWLGTYGGGLVRRLDDRFEVLDTTQGLALDQIGALAFDAEGGLFVGTLGAGLDHLTVGRFEVVGRPEGLSEEVVWTVLEDRRGTLWIGTDGGGLCRRDAGSWRCLRRADGLPSDIVLGLYEAPDGAIWAATPSGVARITSEGMHSFGREAGLANEDAYAVASDAAGRVVVGTTGGVFGWNGRRFEGLTRELALVDVPTVNTFLRTKDGAFWMGTNGAGLRQVRDGKVSSIAVGTDSRAQVVVHLAEDRHGDLWASTLAGVARRTAAGGWQRFGRNEGLPSEQVWGLIEDDRETFWLSTNRGVVSIPHASFDAVAGGRATRLETRVWGRADGLRSQECNLGRPPLSLGRDGRIWFATTRGAASLDPRGAEQPLAPPPVAITAVLRDGRPLPPAARLDLSPGVERLELRFEGYSFRAPERLRFRYRLLGFDSGWNDVDNGRSASYTRVPPGAYRFEVEAAHEGGAWSRQPAGMAIEIAPRLWERTSFRVAAALALALLGAAGYAVRHWSRIRAFKRRQLELEAEVATRTAELRTAQEALERHARQLETSNLLLEQLSLQDALTGCVNRRGFDAAFERTLSQAARHRDWLGLLLVDVDHFKLFNDSLGHPAGDECLRRVAAELQRALRASDLLARYGGEEFAVLLPDTDEEGTRVIGERLRAAVEQLGIHHPMSPSGALVTVSLGAASRQPAAVADGPDLLAAADRALYAAKSAGRNRLVAA